LIEDDKIAQPFSLRSDLEMCFVNTIKNNQSLKASDHQSVPLSLEYYEILVKEENKIFSQLLLALTEESNPLTDM